MSGYGGWDYNGPGFLPSGEPLHETGAGSNYGQYSSPGRESTLQGVGFNPLGTLLPEYWYFTK
jgi:hypothetical protein